MELQALATELREFVDQRNWTGFHTPRNLALALAGEVGELAAELQWLSDDEAKSLDGPALKAVSDEMADVLIYLVRLADTLDVDLIEAARDKLALNRQRFLPSPDGSPAPLTPVEGP